MNHTNLAKLLIYMGNPHGNLNVGELEEYIWLVEQLLQELRHRQLDNKYARPLAPFTRP